LLAGLAMTAVAHAEAPASPAPEPSLYICQITHAGAFGQIWYQLTVSAGGGTPSRHVQWQLEPRAEGLKLTVGWDGPPTADGGLDDHAWATVYFQTAQRVGGEARIEIRRTPGQRYPGEFAYAGPFLRLYRWEDRPLHYIETQGRWGEIRHWMAGVDTLTFALVRRDGKVVSEDRLDAATIAGATAAIAAARPEAEAMAADYRRQCRPLDGAIVVTGGKAR
jgi:hypothetical protein